MKKKSEEKSEDGLREEVLPAFLIDASDIPIEPNGNPLDKGRKITRILEPFHADSRGYGKKK